MQELRPPTQNHFAIKKKEFHKVLNIYSEPLIIDTEFSLLDDKIVDTPPKAKKYL
jgi:hypothetical protein